MCMFARVNYYNYRPCIYRYCFLPQERAINERGKNYNNIPKIISLFFSPITADGFVSISFVVHVVSKFHYIP